MRSSLRSTIALHIFAESAWGPSRGVPIAGLQKADYGSLSTPSWWASLIIVIFAESHGPCHADARCDGTVATSPPQPQDGPRAMIQHLHHGSVQLSRTAPHRHSRCGKGMRFHCIIATTPKTTICCAWRARDAQSGVTWRSRKWQKEARSLKFQSS